MYCIKKEAFFIKNSLLSPKKSLPVKVSSATLQHILYGKALLLDELTDYQSLLSFHTEQGDLGYLDAIQIHNSSFTCNRCGTTKKYHFYRFPCARCQKQCVYCRNCIMMGKSQTCTKLVVWTGNAMAFPKIQNPLQWEGSLSEGQLAASSKVVEAVENKQDCLVWAVCGAGKTEVLFEGIAAALSKGQRVCIATPRTDVVLELSPRLKKVFPHTSVATLYGGSEEKQICAQLVISTTHQLFRYYQAFDMMIIDEVDAFPYSVDSSLQFAVEKSRKQASSLIYLTATPSASMQRAALTNKLSYITIPARFHRHPIPVPQCKWSGNWQKIFSKGKIPKLLHKWYLQKLQTQTPFLIFFPSIDLMNRYLPLFQSEDPHITSVHSEDPERKEKVQNLREGKTLGLLTTTILERGVTIPNLHVAVIGAEEEIFTESALVQIAGRVGRSAANPSGEVLFFHYGKTNAMNKAIKQIQRMNREARERGLLND